MTKATGFFTAYNSPTPIWITANCLAQGGNRAVDPGFSGGKPLPHSQGGIARGGEGCWALGGSSIPKHLKLWHVSRQGGNLQWTWQPDGRYVYRITIPSAPESTRWWNVMGLKSALSRALGDYFFSLAVGSADNAILLQEPSLSRPWEPGLGSALRSVSATRYDPATKQFDEVLLVCLVDRTCSGLQLLARWTCAFSSSKQQSQCWDC